MTNKEKFAEAYAEAFQEAYPNLDVKSSKALISKTIAIALKNIYKVSITGEAFKLTCSKLGINHSHEAIATFVKEK